MNSSVRPSKRAVVTGFALAVLLCGVNSYLTLSSSAPHRYIWLGMGFLLASGLTILVANWRVIVAALRSLVALKQSTDDDDPIMGVRGFRMFAVVAVGCIVAEGIGGVLKSALSVAGLIPS